MLVSIQRSCRGRAGRSLRRGPDSVALVAQPVGASLEPDSGRGPGAFRRRRRHADGARGRESARIEARLRLPHPNLVRPRLCSGSASSTRSMTTSGNSHRVKLESTSRSTGSPAGLAQRGRRGAAGRAAEAGLRGRGDGRARRDVLGTLRRAQPSEATATGRGRGTTGCRCPPRWSARHGAWHLTVRSLAPFCALRERRGRGARAGRGMSRCSRAGSTGRFGPSRWARASTTSKRCAETSGPIVRVASYVFAKQQPAQAARQQPAGGRGGIYAAALRSALPLSRRSTWSKSTAGDSEWRRRESSSSRARRSIPAAMIRLARRRVSTPTASTGDSSTKWPTRGGAIVVEYPIGRRAVALGELRGLLGGALSGGDARRQAAAGSASSGSASTRMEEPGRRISRRAPRCSSRTGSRSTPTADSLGPVRTCSTTRARCVIHAIRRELGRLRGGEAEGDRYFFAFLKSVVKNFDRQAREHAPSRRHPGPDDRHRLAPLLRPLRLRHRDAAARLTRARLRREPSRGSSGSGRPAESSPSAGKRPQAAWTWARTASTTRARAGSSPRHFSSAVPTPCRRLQLPCEKASGLASRSPRMVAASAAIASVASGVSLVAWRR